MTFDAKTVMTSAAKTLLDEDYVRWTLPELLDYLNEGVREIVSLKPTAATKPVTLTLAAGTLQTLPSQYTVLSRVTRNLTKGHLEAGGPVGASAIRPIKDRALLDALYPDWQSSTTMFAATVKHVIYDIADPNIFYVVPGNTGAGKIEAIVGIYPDAIAAPAAPTLIGSYTSAVGLPDAYCNALINYVCYKAFSKDAGLAGAAQRSQAHLALFQGQIGAQQQSEAALALPAVTPAG